MTSKNILVAGARGMIGSALIPELLGRGATVTAMTRSATWSMPGTATSVADLDDPRSIRASLEGIDIVFLNSPSTADAAHRQITFAHLARQAGVEKLVLLSQYAADQASPVRFLRWHADVEGTVRTLDINYTILRPNLFMQSFFAFASSIAQGVLAAPIGDAPVSAIDVRDIAASAAVVLTQGGHEARTYTLTGPRAITHAQVAGAIAQATGRSVTFQQIEPAHFADSLSGLLPAWLLDGLIEDYAHYARDEASEVHGSVRDLTGVQARDIEDFARVYAGAFESTPPTAQSGSIP
jgi:uncharacterized protein YbjT (DUF2867 family)